MLINREMDKHYNYLYNEILIKKNKPLIHATTWVVLKNMLEEDIYKLMPTV